MRKYLWPLSTALLLTGQRAGFAQFPPPARHATAFDLDGASGPTLNDGSAAAWRLWGLDAAGRFQVGPPISLPLATPSTGSRGRTAGRCW